MSSSFFSDLDESSQTVPNDSTPSFFSDLSEEPSRGRSLASAFPKGLIKGASNFASLHDPIGSLFKKEMPQYEKDVIEQVLPTQKGKFTEGALEKAGEMSPYFLGGPESVLSKSMQIALSSLGKQGLQEMGAPEIVQEIGGAVGALSPHALKGLASKKFIPNKVQKEVYELLKSNGFSDKQIVPYIQNKKKVSLLAKWAKPFLNREELKKGLSSIGDEMYGSISEKGKNLPSLSSNRKTAFLHQFDKTLEDIPYFHKDLIEKDILKLKGSKFNWKDFRDFELAINNKIKGSEGGKEVLGRLKEATNFAEKSISPELFKEKQLINKIYSSGKDLLKKLPKETTGKILSNADTLGGTGALALSFVLGNPLFAKGFFLKKGTELAAARLLVSPRFQNLRLKLAHALANNHQSVVLNLTEQMIKKLDSFVKENNESVSREEYNK